MVNQVKTSDEIKVKSVKAYINGEGSLSTISHKVGISERQFREWIRKYKTNGVEGLIRVNKKDTILIRSSNLQLKNTVLENPL
ncbi:helix-turn-helix domain containing protein [Paraclostridium sp. AKS46]|nr:helix-turn-helix domain containing protein [Paraclostridium sp. AKS46]